MFGRWSGDGDIVGERGRIAELLDAARAFRFRGYHRARVAKGAPPYDGGRNTAMGFFIHPSTIAGILHLLIVMAITVRVIMKRPATGVALAWLLSSSRSRSPAR